MDYAFEAPPRSASPKNVNTEFSEDILRLKQIELDSFKEQKRMFLSNFNRKEFSDVQINVNNKKRFYVNRFLLASLSEIFAKMFFDSNWCRKGVQKEEPGESSETKTNDSGHYLRIDLNEEDECEDVFQR
jgi:hypothetical protein